MSKLIERTETIFIKERLQTTAKETEIKDFRRRTQIERTSLLAENNFLALG